MPRRKNEPFTVDFTTGVSKVVKLPEIDRNGMTRAEREEWWRRVLGDFENHMKERLEQMRRDAEQAMEAFENAKRLAIRSIPKELLAMPFYDVVDLGRCHHEALELLRKKKAEEKKAADAEEEEASAALSENPEVAKSTIRKKGTTRRKRGQPLAATSVKRGVVTRSVTRGKRAALTETQSKACDKPDSAQTVIEVTPFVTSVATRVHAARPGLLAPIAEDSPASAAAKETIMAKISNATKGMPRATLLSLAERLDDVLGKILSSSRV
ncbi:tol-Pal system protein TolA-like isoform X3 [Oscarella lobularis]|uniref:tol-Pal system protein TolA-like isoform X3 n=1 Tax=Oscarella lobularis TaxID=121494 RepID=UPI003313D7F1